MSRNLEVLLIEDDIGDVVLVERALSACQQSFVLHHCECLEDACEKLSSASFDVALLDLSLPDSFGLSALEKIRQYAADLPIVVLTGLSDDGLAMQSLEQGAQDYIVKSDANSQLLERTLQYAVQRQQIQSENRRLLLAMQKLARHDPLTGVLNRHAFEQHLDREWQRASRYSNSLACAVLDIDFFKRINDTFGHSAGDIVLKEVANKLSANVRPTDFVGRLGGEEFCVLLPDINEEGAFIWAERARKQISKLVVPIDGTDINVTVSLGVSVRHRDLSKPETMLDQADQAMFVAKQFGRNRVVSYGSLIELGKKDRSKMWQGVSASDLMRPLAFSMSPDQLIAEASQLMYEHKIEFIPVIDTEENLVGVIAEDDIMASVLTANDSPRSVKELMKSQVVTYPETVKAREVCEFLCRTAVQQVFIVEGTRPIGIIQRKDFIRWFSQSSIIKAAGPVGSSVISPITEPNTKQQMAESFLR